MIFEVLRMRAMQTGEIRRQDRNTLTGLGGSGSAGGLLKKPAER